MDTPDCRKKSVDSESRAARAYRGEAGTRYWERNHVRLDREASARRIALRSLMPRDLWRNASWLEVGCGRGHNLCAGDVGLDCDERQLPYLPSGVVGVVGHATALPFYNGQFPVVFSVGCLMHLPSPAWQQAAAEMARVAHTAVILGEYDRRVGEETEEAGNGYWTGMLWRRSYEIPGMFCRVKFRPLPPFDRDVTFWVFFKEPLCVQSRSREEEEIPAPPVIGDGPGMRGDKGTTRRSDLSLWNYLQEKRIFQYKE